VTYGEEGEDAAEEAASSTGVGAAIPSQPEAPVPAIAASVTPGPDGGVVQIVEEADDEEPPAAQTAGAEAAPARAAAAGIPLRTTSIAMVIPAQHLFGA
jgi:hypothetical protein